MIFNIVLERYTNYFLPGTYQVLMDKGLLKDKNGELVFYKNVVAGGVVGGVATFLASPLYLVKVHMQAEAAKEISFGHQHHHEGTWKALRKIYAQHGVSGCVFEVFGVF